MKYSEKYGYTPDRDAIGRAIEMIAANMENIATEQVYKDCFSMMDLTTLKTDDTPASVTKLVEKVNSFHNIFPEWPYPASICVFSNFASTVKEARKGDYNITVVSACFPSSQSFLEVKLKEVEMAVEQGADEVDIVLALNAFLAGDYEAASDEIRQVRRVIDEVAGKQNRNVHLKVILETGLLKTPENIADASFLAMEAGADFIKTSTGKKIGFKPAGGISSAADALCYYSIVSSLLGKEWLNKELFRFGVSRVANSILSAVEQKTVSYF